MAAARRCLPALALALAVAARADPDRPRRLPCGLCLMLTLDAGECVAECARAPRVQAGVDGVLCANTCGTASDLVCQDGGDASVAATCELGTDCADCGPRLAAPPPPMPPPAPPGTAKCDDSCIWAADGECDDGGRGALFDVCQLGEDCTDCGPRIFSEDRLGGGARAPHGCARCTVDLAQDFAACEDGAAVAVVRAVRGTALLEAELPRDGALHLTARVCQPSHGWLIDVGDSPRNGGWGGDAPGPAGERHDAELQLHAESGLAAFSAEAAGNRIIAYEPGALNASDCADVSLVVEHGSAIVTVGNKTYPIRDRHFFATDPERGAEDSKLYVGLNRVVSAVRGDRVGSGVAVAVAAVTHPDGPVSPHCADAEDLRSLFPAAAPPPPPPRAFPPPEPWLEPLVAPSAPPPPPGPAQPPAVPPPGPTAPELHLERLEGLRRSPPPAELRVLEDSRRHWRDDDDDDDDDARADDYYDDLSSPPPPPPLIRSVGGSSHPAWASIIYVVSGVLIVACVGVVLHEFSDRRRDASALRYLRWSGLQSTPPEPYEVELAQKL